MKVRISSLAPTAIVLTAFQSAQAQSQNISSIPYWLNPRCAIVQNTLVIEGGLRANSTYSDGNWGTISLQSSPYGRLYYMSLCSSFNTSTANIDTLPYAVNESSGPGMNSWVGGALFADEYEWYTFGGVPVNRRKSTDLNVIQANMYLPNAAVQSTWVSGVNSIYPPENSANVSNDIAFGAWTNAPSEELGFWFSGLQSASGGVIDLNAFPNHTDQANTTSSTFIKVDMSSPTKALWENMTWPSWLAPRSEAGLVWLPYGNNGILLAFGGIDLPGDQSISNFNLNSTEKSNEVNNYMLNIAVYDIANDNWSQQPTLETGQQPPQTAQFCTVTASAADNSSHFIYVYGGYDGTFHNAAAYDTVWVLSVPAFQWTQVNAGTAAHRRMRHQCVLPNPTQMLSIGGGTEQPQLTNPDWLDVYDLNANEWTHFYNASSSATYQVPSSIISQLGEGNATGGFTIPSTLNSTVSAMLTDYHKVIPGYSPYNWCAPNATTTNNGSTPGTPGSSPASKASHTPAWQTPVIAVLATIAGLALIGIVLFCCCCRGRRNQKGKKHRSIFAWMDRSDARHSPSDPDTDRTAVNDLASPGGYLHNKHADTGVYEMQESVLTSPHSHSYNSPRGVTSPSFGGEMESGGGSVAHEIMTNPPRDSMSIGQHPYYPHSIQGDFINRSQAGTESISSPSMKPVPSALAANVQSRNKAARASPFEMAHDSSRENLHRHSPDDNTLDISSEGGTTSAYGTQQQMHSPTPISPAVARKPVKRSGTDDTRPITPPSGELRPQHHRHQSSLSSDVPTLPSPTTAEEQRRSRMISGLPDVQGNIPQQPTKKPNVPLKSIYQEKFDE